MRRILFALLIALAPLSSWAANEVQINYGETGKTLYFVDWSTAGTAWNGTAYAAYTTTRDTWDIVMTETPAGTGYYVGALPAVAGNHRINIFLDADGGTPSHTNDVAVAEGMFYFDLSLLDDAAIASDVADIVTVPTLTIEHANVPGSRTLIVGTRRDTGSTAVSANIRMRAGETLYWALDFSRTQLTEGDLISGVSAPTVTGAQSANLTVPTYGAYGTKLKLKVVLSSAALTTDTITVNVTIAPESGETFKVAVPVTVIQ
jgi:hypothetical protein